MAEDDLFADYQDIRVDDDEKFWEEATVEQEEPIENQIDENNDVFEYQEDEKKNRSGESWINPSAEWRLFAGSTLEAVRTGKAARGNRLLSTLIEGGKGDKRLQRLQDLINKTSRTDEEVFNDVITQYAALLNINPKVRDDLIEYVVPYIRKIKYKNALTTLLAYVCIENGKINNTKMEKILEIAIKDTPHKIRLPDMYRYAFMILSLTKKKEV